MFYFTVFLWFSECEDLNVPRTTEPRVPAVCPEPEGRRREKLQLQHKGLLGEDDVFIL